MGNAVLSLTRQQTLAGLTNLIAANQGIHRMKQSSFSDEVLRPDPTRATLSDNLDMRECAPNLQDAHLGAPWHRGQRASLDHLLQPRQTLQIRAFDIYLPFILA